MKTFLFITSLVLIIGSISACCQECRQDFVNAMEKQINAMNNRIEELKKDAAVLKDEAKVKAQNAIAELCALRDKALVKLKELKQASGEAWQDLKPVLKESMDGLEDAFKKIKSRF